MRIGPVEVLDCVVHCAHAGREPETLGLEREVRGVRCEVRSVRRRGKGNGQRSAREGLGWGWAIGIGTRGFEREFGVVDQYTRDQGRVRHAA